MYLFPKFHLNLFSQNRIASVDTLFLGTITEAGTRLKQIKQALKRKPVLFRIGDKNKTKIPT